LASFIGSVQFAAYVKVLPLKSAGLVGFVVVVGTGFCVVGSAFPFAVVVESAPPVPVSVVSGSVREVSSPVGSPVSSVSFVFAADFVVFEFDFEEVSELSVQPDIAPTIRQRQINTANNLKSIFLVMVLLPSTF
jgi:hypothetical protein